MSRKKIILTFILFSFILLIVLIIFYLKSNSGNFYYQLVNGPLTDNQNLVLNMVGDNANFDIKFEYGSGLFDKAKLVKKGNGFVINLYEADGVAQKMLASYTLSGHIKKVSPGPHTLKVVGLTKEGDKLLGETSFVYNPTKDNLVFDFNINTGPKDLPKSPLNTLSVNVSGHDVDFETSFVSGGGNFGRARLVQDKNIINIILSKTSNVLQNMFVSYHLTGTIKGIAPGSYKLVVSGELTELTSIVEKDFEIK